MPDRFKKHPSGILIGRTYKIKDFKPEKLFKEEPEQRKETLKNWEETHQQIQKETKPQPKPLLSEF